MRHYSAIFLYLMLINTSCSISPKKIEYGFDNCHFCNMTIIDNKFSAELVTIKGRVFKFDAIECMIRSINENTDLKYSYILVADHSSPGNLFDAHKGSFIISKNIPSPMGAFLSGYPTEDIAKQVLKEAGGTFFDWDGIKQEYINK